jgi:hypothetical protein
MVLSGFGFFLQGNSCAPGQQLQCFTKINPLVFLNKRDDITVFLARPASVALPARIDIERRAMVIVERAKPLKCGADGTQGDIAAHDINNVVGIFDLPNQASPVVSQKATRVQDSPRNPANGLGGEVLSEAEPIRLFLGTP